jgi:hypothetical protein
VASRPAGTVTVPADEIDEAEFEGRGDVRRGEDEGRHRAVRSVRSRRALSAIL